MPYVDFLGEIHTQTKRDYTKRVVENDKSECAEVAKQFGSDYWDGNRKYGYGGYYYDGRWKKVAVAMQKYYNLQAGMRVLDVGCGKGYLLYELLTLVPGLEICGIDISEYALEQAKKEVRPYLELGLAQSLPYKDNSFDLVFSLTTLHNIKVFDLFAALHHIERVSRRDKYILIESFRSEREKMNLLYWQLTCESFYAPEEWEWIFKRAGYKGDYGYIYFE